jgi:hypothetical protein
MCPLLPRRSARALVFAHMGALMEPAGGLLFVRSSSVPDDM